MKEEMKCCKCTQRVLLGKQLISNIHIFLKTNLIHNMLKYMLCYSYQSFLIFNWYIFFVQHKNRRIILGNMLVIKCSYPRRWWFWDGTGYGFIWFRRAICLGWSIFATRCNRQMFNIFFFAGGCYYLFRSTWCNPVSSLQSRLYHF